MRVIPSILLTTLTSGWVLAVPPSGGPYELTRSTLDGGGAMRSTGGSFELSGTLGQPDAGPLTGGAFTLTGGFWFAEPPGDCDATGAVTLFDHALLADCLLGPTDLLVGAGCDCFDFDLDADVDLMDFAEFARLLPAS